MNFAEYLDTTIQNTESVLCAGFDPQLELLPPFLKRRLKEATRSFDLTLQDVLSEYLFCALDAVNGRVATIKCNIAFFEQFGIPGLTVFGKLCEEIRKRKIPLIIDCKRGDIGSTAEAYARSYLSTVEFEGHKIAPPFEADAITVSPYLGFDTLEPFLKAAKSSGKGLFILVRTSNPGSAVIQAARLADTKNGEDPASSVAKWISDRASELSGSSNLSGLGAVVGAPYPAELARFRSALPRSILLIPGLGAQGATASDVAPGFIRSKELGKIPSGAIVNVSRGLFSASEKEIISLDDLFKSVRQHVDNFNHQLRTALA